MDAYAALEGLEATLRTYGGDASEQKLACLHVLESYPAGADPTAEWGESMWSNLFRTLELGKGEEIGADVRDAAGELYLTTGDNRVFRIDPVR